jgi:ABC-2 type transport system permease protein
MDLETVWTIAAKDLSVVRRKKSIFYAIILLPLFVSVGLPGVIWLVERRASIPDADLMNLMNAFAFFFVIVACIIPTGIASYSIVGEKVEKSLEPLLATPARDSEIFLGKSLAAFLPTITAIYACGALFMGLMNALTYGQLGHLFYPNWTVASIMLLVVPLAIIFSVELSILISSRVNDIRTANSLGGIAVMPFGGIYVSAEIGLISLNTSNLLLLSAVLLVADAGLFYLCRAIFRREEILTMWK